MLAVSTALLLGIACPGLRPIHVCSEAFSLPEGSLASASDYWEVISRAQNVLTDKSLFAWAVTTGQSNNVNRLEA